ncbi:hypothetical protein [uncultured Amphritea sp.]|uniref:hypothetical protein n=1 Tax=uncultured Amphritea sp. TaxID=981605 RepID=UPI0025F64A2A|nr:hypothetical protein [uncultured Amphritea sp.]
MDHIKKDLINNSYALMDFLEGYFSQPGERVMSASEQTGIVLVLRQVRENMEGAVVD